MRIAYLGPAGTYTEAAALRYSQQATLLPFPTVDDAVAALAAGKADLAVVPVENSTEGSVARTLDLLNRAPVQVCAELYLPIHHQLISHAASLQAVHEVLAHPQALAQCRNWLDAHLPNAVRNAAPSNAQAVVAVSRRKDAAAIAGVRAAELYDVPVLAKDIEDQAANTTRFLVLGHDDGQPTGRDKTSFICSVQDKAGALYELLGVLAEHHINMTKIESRPAPDTLWGYIFYIDIDGHRNDTQVGACLAELEQLATYYKLLGSYPAANGQGA